MSFFRMMIAACLAGGLAHVDTVNDAVVCIIIAAGFWCFTSDPLPAAIERGLDDYAKKWRDSR